MRVSVPPMLKEVVYLTEAMHHCTSCQPEYRDLNDVFRLKSFYSSHYVRDQSPHKTETAFYRDSPVSRKESSHSRSGFSVSSRSYSPERTNTYSFHQSQHRSKDRTLKISFILSFFENIKGHVTLKFFISSFIKGVRQT